MRTNTKGMNINIERLADSVAAIEERQEHSAKTMELIHILVHNQYLHFKCFFHLVKNYIY